MSQVSGSLDEEDAEDITKGFKIISENKLKSYKLTITDGFKTDFEFVILDNDVEGLMSDFYLSGKRGGMMAFILDGGPKVASCVINGKLYNACPSGWKFFPREFGEIGGNNIEINEDVVKKFMIFDRALMTSECIDLYRESSINVGSANTEKPLKTICQKTSLKSHNL